MLSSYFGKFDGQPYAFQRFFVGVVLAQRPAQGIEHQLVLFLVLVGHGFHQQDVAQGLPGYVLFAFFQQGKGFVDAIHVDESFGPQQVYFNFFGSEQLSLGKGVEGVLLMVGIDQQVRFAQIKVYGVIMVMNGMVSDFQGAVQLSFFFVVID